MTPTTEPAQAYSRPPIVEAVLGITFADRISDAALAKIDRRFAKHYPAHQDNIQFTMEVVHTFGANARGVSNAQHETVKGHKRNTPSMDEAAVLMPDSLTVAQLAPYQGWDAFFERMCRDLALFKRPGTYREIKRIGLRYINRIDISSSGPAVDLERYLNLFPRVPDSLGAMLGYSMQTTLDLESIGCRATLNTAPVPSPTLEHASFIVDIDVHKTTDLPKNDAGLLELVTQMRAGKNRIFEACITQTAREEIFGYADR